MSYYCAKKTIHITPFYLKYLDSHFFLSCWYAFDVYLMNRECLIFSEINNKRS